ncbi:hypothetical protein GS907_25965 [Rhodococcus hoagii]|nr:hypothetical protein [Prescottella equi]
MSAPNGGVPAGGVSGGGGLAAHAKRTEAQWKASLYGQVNDRYNGVKLFGSDFNLLGNQVRAHNQLIETQGEQIADLEDFVGTGTTTPIWSSTGGYDLVSFPDAMMSRSYYFDSTYGRTLTEIPAFSQAKRTLDLAFLRGGRDTPTPLEVVRIITGADTGIFDIDAWYVGIYVYDKPNNRMQLLWNSGNLLNVLTGQRMRYHLSTNMTQSARTTNSSPSRHCRSPLVSRSAPAESGASSRPGYPSRPARCRWRGTPTSTTSTRYR